MLSPKTLFLCFYKAGYNTIHHDGIEHAGYLAFLGLLALFPFLVFVVALAGFFGEGQAGTEFIQLVFSQLPPHMVKALSPRVAEIISGPPQGLLTISILGAIWTSSSAVEGYRTVLNRAYHVATPPAYIWRRLLSIAQILTLSFTIVLAMIALILVPILGESIRVAAESSTLNIDHITALSLLVLFVVVSVAYYFLPNIRQSVRSVMPGALLVTVSWMGTARLLSQYLAHFDQVNLIYGSLGGIIAALLFFYVCNIIFIYGAELNYLLKRALGERIEQKQEVR